MTEPFPTTTAKNRVGTGELLGLVSAGLRTDW